MLLAIHLAATQDDLAWWWERHKPQIRLLHSEERAIAVAAKDRRKAEL